MNRFYNPYYMPTYYYPSYNIPVRTPYYVYLEGGLLSPEEVAYLLLQLQSLAYDPYALLAAYDLLMQQVAYELQMAALQLAYNNLMMQQQLQLLQLNIITDDDLKEYYKQKYINKEEYKQLKKLDYSSRYNALELMLLEKQDNSTKLRKKKTPKKSSKKYSFQDEGITDELAYRSIDTSYD